VGGLGSRASQLSLARHGIASRGPKDRQKFRTPPELDDPDWLRQQYSSKSGAQIASELGVSIVGLHKAMRRAGIEADGPWVRRDTRRLTPPPTDRLEQLWEPHRPSKAVAQALAVSQGMATVWLADVGSFLHDVPAISKTRSACGDRHGQSIDEIAAAHHLATRAVMIELRRHGLVEQHKHRSRA
jgi:hypothetical protein